MTKLKQKKESRNSNDATCCALLMLVVVVGFVVGVIAWREVSDVSSTNETIVAEVVDLWSWRYGDWSRSEEVYRITLNQDGSEFSCDVIWPPMIRQWHELEIGQRYEFKMVRSGNRCYIEGAVETDEP